MFEVCCRLCLEQTPLSEIHSLYSKHKEFIIRDKIYQLFQIKFSDTEKLSTICNGCLEKIDIVDDIRNLFVASEEKFQILLKGNHDTEQNDSDTKQEVLSQEEIPTKASEATSTVSSDYLPSSLKQETYQEPIIDEVELICNVQEEEDELLEPSLVDVTEHLSEAEISVYEDDISSLEEESRECKTEGDEFSNVEHVIYTSDQSFSSVNQESLKPAEMIHNVDCTEYDIDELLEVDDEKLTSLDVSDDERIGNDTTQHQCNVCQDIFENKIALIRHTNTAHFPEYAYHCRHCSLIFQSTTELKMHDCAQKPRIFECSECTERFRNVKDLRVHTQNAHQIKKEYVGNAPRKTNLYKCDFCSEILPNSNRLIEHGRLSHPNIFVLHSCERCEKTFGNLQSAHAHQVAHEKHYECSHCGKICPTAVSLSGHENTHTKDQPFQCSECGRNFAQYTSMRRHMKIHFNEKAYQCDMCPKRFRQRSVMLTHRRIHTGEKPFNCGICNKTFRDHSTLAKHKRVHEKGTRREK
ncbi:zinc finger protein 883-like [Topomyia yanbarensis]|uniref:zinc finger protein 883-like n=1 Tax=Topomyia yanbarensis TaxID=2498891 RepID=UPI00273C663C|nr:zinc finger protein 883-like [Topomyia yanbarensis]XP_058821856.1 zinc finger protein 883-like [Topomyia yanbarensis]